MEQRDIVKTFEHRFERILRESTGSRTGSEIGVIREIRVIAFQWFSCISRAFQETLFAGQPSCSGIGGSGRPAALTGHSRAFTARTSSLASSLKLPDYKNGHGRLTRLRFEERKSPVPDMESRELHWH